MPRKTGILVFTHGSRSAPANAALVRLVDQLRDRFAPVPIEACFMELGEPLIPEAIARLVARGCNHLFGYALFLVAGTHLQDDVPRIFAETLRKHPGVTFEISPPLLADPLLVEFVARHIEQALERRFAT
jgi:sirohydrochlorin ferrochelatase